MKPLHSALVMLSRCPCCNSRYAKHKGRVVKNDGKSGARQLAKRELNKELVNGS